MAQFLPPRPQAAVVAALTLSWSIAMKALRSLLTVVVVGAAALAIDSCGGTSPTGLPATSQARSDVVSSLLDGGLTGLVSCSPLPYDSVTEVVGPEGGTIRVGPHALRIPAGALSQPTTITAVVSPASVNLVQFSPQGLQFALPAQLAMSYANCSLVGRLLPKHIAYTTDDLRILELITGIDLLLDEQVEAPIRHFSHYAVAW